MKNSSGAMRGGAIILVILIMLSLTVFGVLAMVSAHSDYVLAQKRASWVARYYELDTLGQAEVAEAMAAAAGGFYDLDLLGWTVEGARAEKTISLPEGRIRIGNITLEQRRQDLLMAVEYDGGELRVVAWKQIQESFEYDSEENNVWDGGSW